MRRLVGTLLVVLALVPASALAADTVGSGQVITDPAAQTEQSPTATGGAPQAARAHPAHPTRPHVRHATSPTAPAATPRAVPARAVPVTSPAPPAAASTRRATLPFTGVDAGALALAGLALLAAGSGLLAVLRQPVQ